MTTSGIPAAGRQETQPDWTSFPAGGEARISGRSNIEQLRKMIGQLQTAYNHVFDTFTAENLDPLKVRDPNGRYVLLDALTELVRARTALAETERPRAVPDPGRGTAEGPGRPWEELRSSGLLWLINASVFHPRGFALALTFAVDGLTGWQLRGDGTEPWQFPPDVAAADLFAAAQATLDQVRAAR